MNRSKTYCIKAVPQEHRFMQSPEVDRSAFDEEVTFSESDSCSVSKLHKDSLEPLLCEWR